LLIGVIATILVTMTPIIRRGVQAMVKLAADQVGHQEDAEQLGGKFGQLVDINIETRSSSDKNTRERLGNTTYNYIMEETETTTSVILNQGFTPRPR